MRGWGEQCVELCRANLEKSATTPSTPGVCGPRPRGPQCLETIRAQANLSNSASVWPPGQRGMLDRGGSGQTVLPDRALCLPTFSHFLIANKLLYPSQPPAIPLQEADPPFWRTPVQPTASPVRGLAPFP